MNKETFHKHQLLRSGGVVLRNGFYVLTKGKESQNNTCSGPFTREEADERVSLHRAAPLISCHWTEGPVEIYFHQQVYEFNNCTRKYHFKRNATAAENWQHYPRKNVFYLRDGNIEWITEDKKIARFDKSFNGWVLVGQATEKDCEFAEKNKLQVK